MGSCRITPHSAVRIGLLVFAWHLSSATLAQASFPGLGQVPQGVQSWLQSKLFQGFLGATNRLRTLPPLAGQLIDGLQRRRLARGDAVGAGRLETLRGWSSYVGLHRGVPALLADLVRNRGLALAIAEDWGRLLERAEARGGGAALPELLVRERAAVLDWARRSLRKARKAFKGGAVSLLLSDLHAEFTADRHFLTDLLAAAAESGLLSNGWAGAGDGTARGGGGHAGTGREGGWLAEQLSAMAQQVLDAARDALFPGIGSRAQRQRRRGGGSRGGGSQTGDDYYYAGEL